MKAQSRQKGRKELQKEAFISVYWGYKADYSFDFKLFYVQG